MALGDSTLCDELADAVVSFALALDPGEVVAPAFELLARDVDALDVERHPLSLDLWEHAMSFLLERSEFCTKTRKHHEQRCKQRAADVQRMNALARLVSGKSSHVKTLLSRANEAADR